MCVGDGEIEPLGVAWVEKGGGEGEERGGGGDERGLIGCVESVCYDSVLRACRVCV